MKTKEEILKEQCPSMDRLFLDDNGVAFRNRIFLAMQNYADKECKSLYQETSSLREQLKEKEDRIVELEEELSLEKSLGDAEFDAAIKAKEFVEQNLSKLQSQVESQSKLIESLAEDLERSIYLVNKLRDGEEVLGNLDADFDKLNKSLTEYNNYKNKQNGE